MTSTVTPPTTDAPAEQVVVTSTKAKRLRARRSPGGRPSRPSRPSRPIRPGDADEAWSFSSSALAVVAIVCGWVLLQMLVLGSAAEARSQHELYSQYRSELAAATAPTGALDYQGNPVKPGDPVALLTIPGLGFSQVVVSGTASGDLLAGPGHLRTTPLPGQQGISVVLGRASTYGSPFRHIGELKAGDTISVQNAQGTVAYVVQDVRRAGDPIPAAPTGQQGRLTLVSAESAGFLSALRAQTAVFVDALAQKAEPTGPVAAGPLPDTEKPMAHDTTALPTLVLLLAGLLALVGGVSAASRRFRLALVWLFATPGVIALAWAVTEQVMRLLPNLM